MHLTVRGFAAAQGVSIQTRIVYTALCLTLLSSPVSAENGFREGGREIGQGFRKLGLATGKAFKESGKAMGEAFKRAGNATGRAFKQAGKKSGQAFKGT